jgi:hypothetical protein
MTDFNYIKPDTPTVFRDHIIRSFINAKNSISKLTNNVISISNMVGVKKLHFFNNLLEMEDSRYLQLGGWKGATVCSAMYNNQSHITCIHDWTDFGGPRKIFLDNFNQYIRKNNAVFIEREPIEVDLTIVPKSNIYYSCNDPNKAYTLYYFLPKLEDVFIYIASDWNWGYVRKETYQMFTEFKLGVLFQMTNSKVNEIIQHWDSGLAVFVLTKKRT